MDMSLQELNQKLEYRVRQICSESTVKIRLYILNKRIDIIIDVIKMKNDQYNLSLEMPEFYNNMLNLLEKINIYIKTETEKTENNLCDQFLDYCYIVLNYIERIMNLLDELYIEFHINKELFDKKYKDILGLIEDCSSKFM
jgi:hypothetical protein